ncbi:MAG: hypothetical protein HDT44_09765 [Ruminococcaceae bacterium]|nr:hypothetical protein [Oscillospiraceae bacterium]
MIKTLITADSNCYLPPELFPEEIPLIQAGIKTEGGSFRESYEISSENLIEYAEEKGEIPQIICPSVEDYRGFFQKHLKNAQSLCHLCCGTNVRESFFNAKKAAESFKNVYVADSRQIGGGMLFQMMEAVKLAGEGFSPEFIARAIDELDSHINSTYTAKDTAWGRKMGIISRNLSTAMDFFCLAPLVTVKKGGIKFGMVFKSEYEYYRSYIAKVLKNKKNIDRSLLIISVPKPYTKRIERYKAETAKYVGFERIAVTDISAKVVCRLGEESMGLHFLTI